MKRRVFLQNGLAFGATLTGLLPNVSLGNIPFNRIVLTTDEKAIADEYLTKFGEKAMPEYLWSSHYWKSVQQNRALYIVKYLVSQGADASARGGCGNGWTTLQCAAYHCPNVPVLEYLVSLGVDINAEDYGYTALHFAAQYATSTDVIEYLVSQGANINANGCRWTPVMIATVFNCNIEIAECFVALGAEVSDEYLLRIEEKKRIMRERYTIRLKVRRQIVCCDD